jgi:hypothetical protein
MARQTTTMWVAAVAVLAACGAAPEHSAALGATTAESEQEAPAEEAQGVDPEDPGQEDGERGTDPHDAGEQAREPGPSPEGDDGEPPWALLPPDDRPEPVEQPACNLASPTPVAC